MFLKNEIYDIRKLGNATLKEYINYKNNFYKNNMYILHVYSVNMLRIYFETRIIVSKILYQFIKIENRIKIKRKIRN